MIAKLTGIVDQIGDDWVVIDVGGVGYLVYCASRTLSRLVVGEPASLMIETHVREDHIHLFGFWDAFEKDWFKLLTTVQGVGARVGLAILSTLSGDELVAAIASADKTAVARTPGVGPKLATRIVSELKDKVAGLALGVGASGGSVAPLSHTSNDAVSALVHLGYSPSEALSAVSHAQAKLDGDADVAALIKAGLAELAPQDHGVKGAG